MRILLIVLAGVAFIWAADWPTQGGGPQRDGWAKSEKAISKENVKDLDLLYKYRADNESRGMNSLTSPLIDGMLITYRGFKEMLVFGGSSDNVFSVDADLNRIIWSTHLEYKADKPQLTASTALCPGGMTAPVTMPGSSSAGGRTFGGAPRPARGAAPAAARAPAGPGATLFASGFGRAGVFFAVASDGYLHALNTSTGADRIPSVKFLPADAKVSGLNVSDTVIYAATSGNCGDNPNALYAIDLSTEDKHVASFPTNGSSFSGPAATAIGTDGTVYVQVAYGHSDVAGEYNDTVLALTPGDLKVKDYFTPQGAPEVSKKDIEPAGVTPVVFPWKGKDVIVAGGRDGRLYLLNAAALGGSDHHQPLSRTEPSTEPTGNGFWGTFASWEDVDTATRWVYASLSGSVIAYKVEDRNGQPVLTQAWTSRDLASPAHLATANGIVFALATGESTHATLYALDGATGKELYSSGNAAATYSHGGGLAVANGRVYFTAHDNMVYCFGFRAAQPQLTDR